MEKNRNKPFYINTLLSTTYPNGRILSKIKSLRLKSVHPIKDLAALRFSKSSQQNQKWKIFNYVGKRQGAKGFK